MVREHSRPTPHLSHVHLSIASPSEIERTAGELVGIREGFQVKENKSGFEKQDISKALFFPTRFYPGKYWVRN